MSDDDKTLLAIAAGAFLLWWFANKFPAGQALQNQQALQDCLAIPAQGTFIADTAVPQ